MKKEFIMATIKEQSVDGLQRVRNTTAIVVNQILQESRSDLKDELEEDDASLIWYEQKNYKKVRKNLQEQVKSRGFFEPKRLKASVFNFSS